MIWETIKEWKQNNKKEYPYWAAVWSYDAYGECWESILYKDIKDFYENERNSKEGNAIWDFQYEPMVCDPILDHPKWGDGLPLQRTNNV